VTVSIERVERDLPAEVARAFELRAQGHSFRDIAGLLGVSVSTAHQRVAQAQDALDFAAGDRAAAQRRDAATIDLWLSRLDADYAKGMGDTATLARTAVQLLARRARLLGLDAPTALRVEPGRPAAAPDPRVLAALQALQDDEQDEDDAA
jgi:hypothetical protein